jgi:hypothetical protein
MSRHGKVERVMSWTKLLTYITGSVDQELLLCYERLGGLLKYYCHDAA